MTDQFTADECDVIVEALNHYKLQIENYQHYSDYEQKLLQRSRVDAALDKMRLVARKTA